MKTNIYGTAKIINNDEFNEIRMQFKRKNVKTLKFTLIHDSKHSEIHFSVISPIETFSDIKSIIQSYKKYELDYTVISKDGIYVFNGIIKKGIVRINKK